VADADAPLRVVQVLFHEDVQGRTPEELLAAWPTLPAVASAVARAGVRLDVVLPAAYPQVIARDGVTYHFVAPPRAAAARIARVRRWRTAGTIIDMIRSLAPDVVHVHGFNYPMAVRRLSGALRGVPVLVQDHGNVHPHGWRRLLFRLTYRNIAGVAFTGREQADPFIGSGVFRRGIPVFDIIGGSSTFTPGDRDASRRTTGMTGDPCILMASHLNSNKDPLTALAAFERTAAVLPDARLHCCYGSAPMIDAVRRRIANSALLRERVFLVGRRPHDEMEARYRAADFFMQTSHREASGFSLIETLACGTMPLVADIPAARRIVGDAGSLTPVGDASALAAAMIACAGGNRLEQRRIARQRFEQALTFDVIGRALCTTYRSLCAVQ
jgi:glycosyltransferase involved in cell wall biosynthesis